MCGHVQPESLGKLQLRPLLKDSLDLVEVSRIGEAARYPFPASNRRPCAVVLGALKRQNTKAPLARGLGKQSRGAGGLGIPLRLPLI
jgi:hypothetical protein